MPQIRIISVVECATEAEAQEVADAVSDIVDAAGGSVDTAPWTKDLSLRRKAEFEALRARARAAKLAADQTAVDKVYASLDADATLDQKAKDAVKALVEASTGIAKDAAVTP